MHLDLLNVTNPQYRGFRSMDGGDFGARRRAQQREPLAQPRDFVIGEFASGLDDRQQQLLDRSRHLAGSDKTEGRADAAKTMGLAVGERDGIEPGVASVEGSFPFPEDGDGTRSNS